MTVNTYHNIARFYDLLMTGGYYDYDSMAGDLQQVVREHDRVLELGVGTGLMAQKLLAACPNIDFTGIDNTPAMLEQAKGRLGNDVQLQLADIVTYAEPGTYDVVFSCGGVWYLIDDDGELQLCSHISDPQLSRQAFENALRFVKPNGCLLLSVQGVHRDFDQQLDDDLIYRQRISCDGDTFHKAYIFEYGNERSVQEYTYRIWPQDERETLFNELGLRMTDAPLRHFRQFAPVGQSVACTTANNA